MIKNPENSSTAPAASIMLPGFDKRNSFSEEFIEKYIHMNPARGNKEIKLPENLLWAV